MNRENTYPRQVAQALLMLVLLLIVIGLTSRSAGIEEPDRDAGDMALGQRIIDEMRAGEDYYSAANHVLRMHGSYASRPFVNFRLPVLATVSSLFPDNFIPQLMLLVLSIAVLAAWTHEIIRRAGLALGLLGGGFLLFGVANATTPGAFLSHDLWAGLLIALSLWYSPRNWKASVACGLAALSIREHAVIFVLVMAVLAWLQGHRREAVAWTAGIAISALYIMHHADLASQYVKPDDPARSWMTLGGWAFVVSTGRWTLLTMFAPSSVSAILTPVALLGLAAYPGRIGERMVATVLSYVVVFMFIGTPDYWYWGQIYAPLLAVGLACSVPALRNLLRCAFMKSPILV